MQGSKQKVKDIASSAKAKAQIYEAKVEEKAERTAARTDEEKEIARQMRKAKEADAKAHLHADKAQHAAEKLETKHHNPLGHGTIYPPFAGDVGGTGTQYDEGGRTHLNQPFGNPTVKSYPPNPTHRGNIL